MRTRSLLLLGSLVLAACGEGITSLPRESTTLELAPGTGLRQIRKGQYRADDHGVWKDGRLMISAARLPAGRLAEIRAQLAFFEATYDKRAKSGCAKIDASGAMVARPGLAAYGDPELSCEQVITYMNNAEASYQEWLDLELYWVEMWLMYGAWESERQYNVAYQNRVDASLNFDMWHTVGHNKDCFD